MNDEFYSLECIVRATLVNAGLSSPRAIEYYEQLLQRLSDEENQ